MIKFNQFKKTLARIIAKGLYILVALAVVSVGFSSSQFFDLEISEANALTAAILDLTLRSDQSNFIPNPPATDIMMLKPGESGLRDIYIGKTIASLALKHQASYQYVSGVAGLCSQLLLSIDYQCIGGGCPINIYNGTLTGLINFQHPDFIIPHPLGDTEQHFLYTVSLPDLLDPIYQDTSCQFNLIFKGFQQDSDGTWGFTDEEVLTGNNIGADDWIAPPVPIPNNPPDGGNVVPDGGYSDWEDETDVGGGPVVYVYELWNGNPDTDPGAVLVNSLETSSSRYPASGFIPGGLLDGSYWWRVRARDGVGNTSAWSALRNFIIDTTVSTTTLMTSNSPLRLIKDDIKNGDFDDGLDNWVINGSVWVKNEESFDTNGDTINDLIIDPHDIPGTTANTKMAVIYPNMVLSGADPTDGSDLYYSALSQAIPNSAKTLSFWFNFMTTDSVGFDNPGFAVYLNGKEIYQLWGQEINLISGNPASSGWKKFYYDLSSIPQDALDEPKVVTLIFFSGNKKDNSYDSWVYLDKISTNDLVVSPLTKIYLETSPSFSPVHTYFKRGNCATASAPKEEYNFGTYPSGGFLINHDTVNDKFCYWNEDEAGNKGDDNEITLIYDDEVPDIVSDLRLTDLTNGEFMLDWTAIDPNDADTGNLTAAQYKVRYSLNPILTETDFEAAISVNMTAPRTKGESEQLDLKGLIPATVYYFAIKTADSASNWSQIAVTTNGPKLVINEVYYDVGTGKGTEDNEWFELYNGTSEAINLKDWKIKDDTTQRVIATTDLWLLPDQFAVVTKDLDTWDYWSDLNPPAIPGSALKLILTEKIGNGLGNDGDRLELRNPDGALIDALSFGDDSTYFTLADIPAGHSWARITKGLDTNTAADWNELNDPNPGTNPHPPSPSPEPSPSPSLSPEPSPSLEPSPSPEVESSPSPGPSEEPSPSPSEEPEL